MCQTIKQKLKLRLSPERVYQVLATSKLHASLTGKEATISKKIGGFFSVLSGDVSGTIVDLLPGKRIVQAWRAKDFPEGIFSMAAIQLTRTKDGGTEVVLTHRGVPKNLIPRTEDSWKTFYWQPLRAQNR